MTAVDDSGTAVWNQRVPDDECDLDTVGNILALADHVHWTIDITGTASAPPAAPLLATGLRNGACRAPVPGGDIVEGPPTCV